MSGINHDQEKSAAGAPADRVSHTMDAQTRKQAARSPGWFSMLKATTATATVLGLLAMPNMAVAQEADETVEMADTQDAKAVQDTIIIRGSLRALPIEDVGSVFGFDKTLTEIPRSASTISSEQIERFGITDIYGLVAQAPGTFTNSFFGVGGALDIRGQAGETYFRGVRRLDNPGNYPTPIGASDRIDIVRGPASPIYGPSKSGGYMNFVPKSARIDGKYLEKPEGEVRYTGGSWDKSVLSGTVTGPGKLGGQEFGYTLYAEIEDSGSYYENISTEQTILQAAFETAITDSFRLEFGTMYHDFDGAQNGGWNRLTQDLVDSGTYITGTAQPIDLDGDGQLSQAEFDAVGTFNPFGTFACANGGVFASGWDDACFADAFPYLALEDVGTANLSRQKVLTGPEDTLENEVITYYFDAIWEGSDGLEIKNQMFYEAYENINLNSYGFSQFHDSWVFEDKIVISDDFDLGFMTINAQLSPSARYTDFKHGDDFDYEFFHRVDLTQGYDARSDRLLALEADIGWSDYNVGNYLDLGLAGLVDAKFDFGLGFLLGLRYDSIEAESTEGRNGEGGTAKDTDEGVSWNASVNYDTPWGVIPYFTASEQTVVVAGQGADLARGDIAGGAFLTSTELIEAGIKGDFLDGRLYAAISYYEQERTDRNVQSSTVNQDISTEGIEAEVRWAATDKLLLTAAYTNTKVVNETYLANGTAFSFFGIEDLVNVSDHSLHLGGQPIGLVPIPDEDAAKRAGIPENLFSFTATYAFDFGLSLSGSIVDVEEVYSGQSQAVTLPAYTLVDLGASYEVDDWLFRLAIKNATDEEYFRANFTELFGSTIVLPEKPRSVEASVIFKF